MEFGRSTTRFICFELKNSVLMFVLWFASVWKKIFFHWPLAKSLNQGSTAGGRSGVTHPDRGARSAATWIPGGQPPQGLSNVMKSFFEVIFAEPDWYKTCSMHMMHWAILLLVADLPQYACSAERGSGKKEYSDCAPVCGHCSDKGYARFICDQCVQVGSTPTTSLLVCGVSSHTSCSQLEGWLEPPQTICRCLWTATRLCLMKSSKTAVRAM